MAHDFEQQVLPFAAFLELALEPAPTRPAYMAHTPLLRMVPRLLDDVVQPACVPSHAEANAWFGPAGTVTPLHHDPQDNVFVQVVGSKVVLLHDASQTPLLYAQTEGELTNTSRVDAGAPDVAAHPLYRDAVGRVAVLRAGDALYVPRGTWHYVTSLEASWSISFWWT